MRFYLHSETDGLNRGQRKSPQLVVVASLAAMSDWQNPRSIGAHGGVLSRCGYAEGMIGRLHAERSTSRPPRTEKSTLAIAAHPRELYMRRQADIEALPRNARHALAGDLRHLRVPRRHDARSIQGDRFHFSARLRSERQDHRHKVLGPA